MGMLGGDSLIISQFCAKLTYIEKCPNISFYGIISDIKPIYETYRILVIHVKS
jgi:hypothetical protein